MAGLLKQFRQDVPKSTIIVNEQNAAIERGLSHHESLRQSGLGIRVRDGGALASVDMCDAGPRIPIPGPGGRSRSVMLAVRSGEVN